MPDNLIKLTNVTRLEEFLLISVKTCSSCKVAKEVTEFSVRKDREGRLVSRCKQCRSKAETARQSANPDMFRARRLTRYKADPAFRERIYAWRRKNPESDQAAIRRYQSKPEVQQRAKEYAKVYRATNREALKAKDKARVTPERNAASLAAFHRKMKDPVKHTKWKEKVRVYYAGRRAASPYFRMISSLRTRQNRVLQGFASTTRGLGCDRDALCVHIESQFQPGMCWNNYGRDGWEIDHVRPLKDVDWNDPTQVAAAIHYTNLQPLWAKDNRSKGCKTKHQTT